MEKLDHPEISPSDLTAEVRKSMARHVLKSHARSTNESGLENTSEPVTAPGWEDDNFTQPALLSTDEHFASLNLQLSGLPKSPKLEQRPVFEPNSDDQYHLNDLLKFHDADFLNAAYRAVLKREPDSFGYNHYLEQLRAGHLDKVDVIAILRFSSEGKLKGVQIKGLVLPTLIRRLSHLPVIGYPIRLGIDLLRLPVLIQRTRQNEAYSLAQNRRVAEHADEFATHVDKVNKALVDYVSNLSATVMVLLKSADLQAERHEQMTQHLAALAGRHDQLNQQLESLAERQQKSVVDLRQELEEQIVEERTNAQEQTQRLIQEQQSSLQSSISDVRNRIAELESSAGARIAQLESSGNEKIAQLDSSARAWIGELESSIRANMADVESSIRATIAGVESSTENIRTKMAEAESTTSDMQGRIGSVESSTTDLRAATDKLESSTNTSFAEIEKVYQQLQHARTELAVQGRRMTLIMEAARTRLPAPFNQQQLEMIATEEQHKLDALYAELEDNFRGTQEEIKERFRTYLPHIKSMDVADMPIVDLGCGRGEWLELLKGEGYRALGVDTNRVLLDRCRARGLEVIENDALKYLRDLPDNSLGVVTGFHIIEHLQIGVLMNLLDEIVRVVRPGGLVLFETPNPENVLVGSNFFYFDPTHRNPLPSLLMKFLLESRGLQRIEVMNLHAWDQARLGGKNELTARFNELFYGPMDYAIAGWKGSE